MSKRKNKPIKPPGREKQQASVEPLEELRELFSRPTEPYPNSRDDRQGLLVKETAATSQLLLTQVDEAVEEPSTEPAIENPAVRRLKELKAAKKEKRLKTIGQALKEMEQAVSQKQEQSIREEIAQAEAKAETKAEAKAETKAEAKAEAKLEAKVKAKVKATPAKDEMESSLRSEIEQAVEQTLDLVLEQAGKEENRYQNVQNLSDRPRNPQHKAEKKPANITKTRKVRGTPRAVAPAVVADLPRVVKNTKKPKDLEVAKPAIIGDLPKVEDASVEESLEQVGGQTNDETMEQRIERTIQQAVDSEAQSEVEQIVEPTAEPEVEQMEQTMEQIIAQAIGSKEEEVPVSETNQPEGEAEAQEQEIYLTIKQVATIVQVELSTIRYWEREFADYLGPSMIRNQRKCFSQDQLEFFTKIKELLKTEQYTIEGAKRRLELDNLLAGSLGVEHNFKNTVFIMFSAIMQELQEARRDSRELTIQVVKLREEKNLVEEQLQEEQSKGLLDFLKTKLNKKNTSDKEV